MPELWEPEDKIAILLPGILQRIAAYLPPNEVPGTLRLVCKATATELNGPEHITIRLSQPVPPHAFQAYWRDPARARRLSYAQRRRLLSVAATSGCIENLEALVLLETYFPLLSCDVFDSAANAGHLHICEWLLARGCPMEESTLNAAASGGHQHIFDWLREKRIYNNEYTEYALAEGGLGEELEHWLPNFYNDGYSTAALLGSAVEGCDLAALKRVYHCLRIPKPDGRMAASLLAAAFGSRTADWRAKVEWLESLGRERPGRLKLAIGKTPDALERWKWFETRGYVADESLAVAAARCGHMGLLRHLLDSGVRLTTDAAGSSTEGAARAGHLDILRELHARGFLGDIASALDGAARGEHLGVLDWLAQVAGEEVALALRSAEKIMCSAAGVPGPETKVLEWLHSRGCSGGQRVMAAAASVGSLEKMAWLHTHGYALDESVFRAAAEQGGCEAQLEWLVEHGCPVPVNGWVYIRVCHRHDLSTLACLKRLGCPWGPPGAVFTQALVEPWEPYSYEDPETGEEVVVDDECLDALPGGPYGCGLTVLRWLLENGCPVDWEAALREVKRRQPYHPEELEWVQEQAQRALQS